MSAWRIAAVWVALCGCDRLFQLGEVKLDDVQGDGGMDGAGDALPQCRAGFAAPVAFGVGGQPYTLTTADLDNDGDLDIVAPTELDDAVSVLLGDGAGGFGAVVAYPAGDKPEMVAVGQVIGDGNLDLVVVAANQNQVVLLPGRGDGTFGLGTAYDTGTQPYAVTVADFNIDGILDFATANYTSNNITVFKMGAVEVDETTSHSVGMLPLAIVPAFINADGYPDLVVANYGSDDVTVLYGDPLAEYMTQLTSNVGDGPNSVAAADLIGDPRPEVLTADFSGKSISALPNESGSLTSALSYTTNLGDVFQVVVADFDRDLRPDIAVTDASFHRVTVFLNDGAGDLSAATRIEVPAGASPMGLVAADLDGNGYTDLAVTNYYAGTVSVMFNCVE